MSLTDYTGVTEERGAHNKAIRLIRTYTRELVGCTKSEVEESIYEMA